MEDINNKNIDGFKLYLDKNSENGQLYSQKTEVVSKIEAFQKNYGINVLKSKTGKDLLCFLYKKENETTSIAHQMEYGDCSYSVDFGTFKDIQSTLRNIENDGWVVAKSGKAKNIKISEQDAIKMAEDVKKILLEIDNKIQEVISKKANYQIIKQEFLDKILGNNLYKRSYTYFRKYFFLLYPNIFSSYINDKEEKNLIHIKNFLGIDKSDWKQPLCVDEKLYNYFNQYNVNDVYHTLEEYLKERTPMTQPLNQILYGPPGTGKTYNTIIKAIEIIKKKEYEGLKKELKIVNENNKKPTVEEFSKWYKENPNYTDNKNVLQSYVKELEKMSEYIGLDIYTLYKLKDYNVIREKLEETYVKEYKEQHPNTNRPYCESALKIYGEFLKKFIDLNENKKYEYLKQEFNSLLGQQIEFITFHQSYSYEEFVEGIKPEIDWYAEVEQKGKTKPQTKKSNDIKYICKKGIFKELCDRARNDKDNNYILIIDEINRGNISKIFGELITLIEDDKRKNVTGDTSKEYNTIEVTLPYSGDTFSVPNNLYIIGTMNTSDRSIASVDIALRRRFKFEEMMPDETAFDDFLVIGTLTLVQIFKTLNQRICALLDRDHQIGHSYFIGANKDNLKDIWFDCIMPLLNEYFYGDWEKLQAILGEAEKENQSKQNAFIKYIGIDDKFFATSKSDICDDDKYYEFCTKDKTDFLLALEHAFSGKEKQKNKDVINTEEADK